MITLLNAVAVDTVGVGIGLPKKGHRSGVLDIEIASAGSVVIEGRNSTALSWKTVAGPITASQLSEIILPEFIRASVTGVSGGNVTVGLSF